MAGRRIGAARLAGVSFVNWLSFLVLVDRAVRDGRRHLTREPLVPVLLPNPGRATLQP